MDVPGISPAQLSLVASGVVMLGLAAALLALRFEHPLNRAFAFFLLARGSLNLLGGFFTVTYDFWWRLANYPAIVVPFAAIAFALAYRRWPAAVATRRLAQAGLSALALLLAVAYAGDHALWRAPDGTTGPLFLLQKGKFLVYALVGLWVAAATRPGDVSHRSALLVGTGFILDPAFFGVKEVFDLASGAIPATPYSQAANLLGMAALAPVGMHLARLASAAGDAASRGLRTRLAAVVWAALGTGGLVGAATALDPLASVPLSLFVSGLWSLALPLMVSYAIVRHQLFGIDLRVKRTIRHSTLVGVFVGVFFLVSQLAENLVEANVGALFGLVAAAALTLAEPRVHRYAQRVADAAMPGVRPVEQLGPAERRAMYVEQVRAAASDGDLSPKDRRVLEVARKALGLTDADAAALEAEALGGEARAGRLRRSGATA